MTPHELLTLLHTAEKLMDPTFASSGGRSEQIMRFIENNGNYTVKYLY